MPVVHKDGLGAVADLDGTLLSWWAQANKKPRMNWSLIGTMVKLGIRSLSIATNQGGLILGYAGKQRSDGVAYPTPWMFRDRIYYLQEGLQQAGITLEGVRVSLYHPYGMQVASRRQIKSCAERVRAHLKGLDTNSVVYTTMDSRKPSARMLLDLHAGMFYGDSDDDRGAAQNAGVFFIPVARFM